MQLGIREALLGKASRMSRIESLASITDLPTLAFSWPHAKVFHHFFFHHPGNE